MKSKIICVMLAVILLCALPVTSVSAADTAAGTVKITTELAGADVYIDGERYVQRCTPCTIPLPVGSHRIELSVKGYEQVCEDIVIAAGQETVIEKRILPEIPFENAVTVTVTTQDDPYFDESLTVDGLKDLPFVSLRQALTAIEKDESDLSYIVDFAENVKHIELSGRQLFFSRNNFVLNGDRDRDGTPDVIFTKSEWGLIFRPMDNLYIIGIRFDDDCSGDSAIGIRPDDYYCGDVSYENIYLLGCEFNNCEIIPFCGACKAYSTFGKVDYTNINACGNVLNNSNMFFAYSGNTDDSTTDGMTYQANKLDETSVLSLMCADCNTNYIYGGYNEASNGSSCDIKIFETSDRNTVKNVLICGNDGGRSGAGVAVNGNSYNTIRDVVFRNNRFDTTLNFRPCQPIDERNEGNTLTMTGNALENVTLEYNIFDFAKDNSSVWLNLLAFDKSSPETKYILENNVLRNIVFRNNLILGNGLFIGDGAFDGAHCNNIEEGIEYTVSGGYVIAHAIATVNDDGINYTDTGNRFEGIYFEENRRVKTYDPYAIWDDSPVHIHTPEYVGWDAANCDRDGHKEYYKCQCGGFFRDWLGEDEIKDIDSWLKTEGLFPATGHEFRTTEVVPATCHTGGYSVRACNKCSHTEAFAFTEKLSHNYKQGTVIPATCDSQGYTEYVCELCGDTYLSDYINNTGHSYKALEGTAKEPSCDSEGRSADVKCINCGKVIKGETIPKTEHSTVENITPPTCVTEGIKTVRCIFCGETRTETVAEPTGHVWDAGNVTTDATTENEGVKTFTCTVCGEIKTEAIPRIEKTEPDFIPGDVDGDGIISVADARLALRRAIGLEDYEEGSREYLACDVDFDTKVSVGDARLILRGAIGLDDPKAWIKELK